MGSIALGSKKVWAAVGCMLFGIALPFIIKPEYTGVLRTIQILQVRPTGNSFMVAVLLLMIWNTVYSLPHYIGAFLLGEEWGRQTEKPWLKAVPPLLLIPVITYIEYICNPLKFPFGLPGVLLLISMFILQRATKNQLDFRMKMLILIQLLLGFQWLEMVPSLTGTNLNTGRILVKMKEMAFTLGFDQALGMYSIMLCFILVISAVIVSISFTMSAQKWHDRKKLHLAQLEAIQSRSGREVLHLVHDLKTPLTSVEGLISLMEMRVQDEKLREYCRMSSQSIASMSEMISEMLYEDKKSWFKLTDVMNYVQASRLSGTGACVTIKLPEQEDIWIWINKIRITRALVNLIDNALDAIKGIEGGTVTVYAEVENEEVRLGVADNGPGISREDQEKIWEAGYSTKRHPGLGLSFVLQVAESHGGYVSVQSRIGEGTTVWMHLRGGEGSSENLNYG
ncbi:HAMP domain-containing histidine kinase [Aneurinibacillus sp. BA2021]|nr:HAMP domain-containing histidine kinase [Aneurinibacillus sp. BA2021]